jgi:hypothetical protein
MDDACGAQLRHNFHEVKIKIREGWVMRYVVTFLVVLGLGITVMAPLASAQVNMPPNRTFTNQYGNTVVPLQPGATGGGGGACYMDGVAYSCTMPAQVYMPTPSDSSGVAGGSPMSDQQYNQFWGGDRN